MISNYFKSNIAGTDSDFSIFNIEFDITNFFEYFYSYRIWRLKYFWLLKQCYVKYL